MSRSAMRESPKYPSTPLGLPDIEHRFRIRIGDELRGSARSLAYAAARASGLVFGFFTMATSSLRFTKCFAASFFLRSLRTIADVFAMCRQVPLLFEPCLPSSPRNGIPSSRSSASAWSSRLAVVTIVMSIPWMCSTMSKLISGKIICSFTPTE